ncbi:transposase [Herbidospora galbida]|uniref:transposase n=1 Tax=Herbidospora galbida TaxID=2575442 RepID=UPI0014854831|nr:transposase [Herbidospora galbida]
MEAISIAWTGPGRPHSRPAHLAAGKGYSTGIDRTHLRPRRISHTLPERVDSRPHSARRGWRRCGIDRERHKRRNIVKHCFNQLKRLHGITTRYNKPAIRYRAAVIIARLAHTRDSLGPPVG